MADLHPASELQPQALVIQLDPSTSEIVEMALRFCVKLPSGQELHDVEHWWKEATPEERKLAKALAGAAINSVIGARELSRATS